MGRISRAVAALAAVLLLAACGEPFVVLGDAPGVMRIVLGIGDSIGTRVDSIAVRTRLSEPASVVFDEVSGMLYAGDRGALRQQGGTTTRVARIFRVTSAGRSDLLLDAGGCLTGTCMIQPTALALAPNGTIVIADQIGNRVFRYTPGGALTVLAGTGTAATAADGVAAATAPLNRPGGVAVADDGRVFIGEAGAHRVRVIGTDGVLRTVAGTDTPAHSGDGGPAAAASLIEPVGLALHEGTLYIADYLAGVVRAITPDGTIATIAGVPNANGFSGDGGLAVDATLSRPVAVAVTPDGAGLIISDQGNDRVRFVTFANGVIQTLAGTGSRTYTGARRPAGQTSLHLPLQVDASAGGFLFIVDSGHSVVWRTSLSID